MTYNGPIWEGIYSSFSQVPVEGPGFDGEVWLNNSLKKMAVLRLEAEKSALLPPPSNLREILLPLVAAVVYQEQRKLKILDFGGSIGFTYYQTVRALPGAERVEYHIVERESVCVAGRKFFSEANGNLFFHEELPGKGVFDIVYLGSTLHYIDDWQGLLSQICKLSPKYLLLVEVPAGDIPTFITAQHHYSSRIPVRFFNINELLSVAKLHGFELTYKSICPSTVLGKEQDLPMQNFDQKYQLRNACNLLFSRVDGWLVNEK